VPMARSARGERVNSKTLGDPPILCFARVSCGGMVSIHLPRHARVPMRLPVVVAAEVVVVPAERLLGRRAMSWVSERTETAARVTVLVSEAVPEHERARVAADALRERRTRNVANDHQEAPASRMLAHGVRRPRMG